MENARIQFQRDFYHLLLRLASEYLDLKQTLEEALKLIVDFADVDRAYIEVRDQDDNLVYQSLHIPDEELANVQQSVSTGIIREAIRTRENLLIPSALIDPRFQSRESVQRLAIESVLCVPFFGAWTTGVLYLQGDAGFRAEAEKIVLDTDLFAQHVSPLLDHLLKEQERTTSRKPMDSLKAQYYLEGVVGESPTFIELLQAAMMIAPLEVNTLLLGETGTGKTQLARLIHQNSARRDKPFVEINCAALPDTLVENELFGAVPGGHSSATIRVDGKITAANGGTLFLDEISQLPLESQAKLLQFIQSGEYYPLGSSKLMKADTRLIFATNAQLDDMVRRGTFREDLFYRINTFELTLPNLEQRKTDIPSLTTYFFNQCCSKHRFEGLSLAEDAIPRLQNSKIEGNIRGLQNVVEKACINAKMKESDRVTREHLPVMTPVNASDIPTDFHSATLSFQQELLSAKLIDTNWNISRTARELNLSRSHVHNLINGFGLTREREM